MLFGLDGTELGLIIVFACVFAGIMTGYAARKARLGGELICKVY